MYYTACEDLGDVIHKNNKECKQAKMFVCKNSPQGTFKALSCNVVF